jgi:hypothetical protein
VPRIRTDISSSQLYTVDTLIVDVAAAIAGKNDTVVGTLKGVKEAGDSSIEVATDGSYAFVAQESGYTAIKDETLGTVQVFKLNPPSANGSVSSSVVGYLPLGSAVVSPVFPADRKYLFVTSEGALNTIANVTNSSLSTIEAVDYSIWTSPILDPLDVMEGSLSVLDVEKLESDPSSALMHSVLAGCSANRVNVSTDGKTVWITARASNAMIVFDAEKLISDPDNAYLFSVRVGQSPVGAIFVRNGTRMLTTDSDRWYYPNETTGVTVIDVEKALNGKPEEANLGSIPTGAFPRELALSPDNCTVLVSCHDSVQVQVIDVESLP